MNEPKQPMLRLFRYLQSYTRSLLFSTSFSIANKVADLMPPLLVGWIIDTVAQKSPAWLVALTGTADAWTNAAVLSVLIVVIFAVESFFEWLYQYGFLTLAQRVQHDLRLDAYQHLQGREIAYFEENRTGNLMAILNDDINQLERFLNDSFNQIIQISTLFVFATIVLFQVSWQLTLIGMIPIPLILWGSIYYQRKISPHYREVREKVGELSNRLENNISGIMVVKSFTAENYEYTRVEKVSSDYRQANYKAIRLSALYVPLIRMLIALGFAGVMLVACYWLLNDINGLTIGALALFGMMIQRILWPVTRLGKIFDEYERAKASARRVFGLMDTPSTIQDPEQAVKLNKIAGSVAFKDVKFHYSNGLPILKGINFSVRSGQRIGIAGATGSGKTTLIKLILRLYDVTSGNVKIDGIDIRAFELKDLRRNIALVSQDVYLFHGSIRENIAYGMDDCLDGAVIAASKKAQLHDFVASLPNGYDTIVGERGLKLSGGQRQRLSIARAILKDAPVLILDEATSAVDTETERAIQQNLHQLTHNRTALIIAHRLSTIRHAHQIIVLNEGQIAERGTHESLLKQEGIYADLWNVQIGEIV